MLKGNSTFTGNIEFNQHLTQIDIVGIQYFNDFKVAGIQSCYLFQQKML